MRTASLARVGAAIILGILLGGIWADIGEARPAFVVGYDSAFACTFLCGVFYVLGFLSGRDVQ